MRISRILAGRIDLRGGEGAMERVIGRGRRRRDRLRCNMVCWPKQNDADVEQAPATSTSAAGEQP